jgi:hypothetical protein
MYIVFLDNTILSKEDFEILLNTHKECVIHSADIKICKYKIVNFIEKQKNYKLKKNKMKPLECI